MMKHFSLNFLLFLFLATMLSCEDDSSNPSIKINLIAVNNGTKSTLQLLNSEIEEINIQILEVKIVKKGYETEPGKSPTKREKSGQFTILKKQKMVNLLNLSTDNEVSLGQSDAKEGNYSQITFVIGNTNNTIKFKGDNQYYTLPVTLGHSRGIKLTGTGGKTLFSVRGNSKTILMELDVLDSLTPSDLKDSYKFRPVISGVKIDGKQIEMISADDEDYL